MKINFRGVGVEELAFKINRVKLEPNTRIDIKPQFARQVRRVKDNDKLIFVALTLKIESTEAEPKPFDVHVSLVGNFEVEGLTPGSEQEREFVIEATRILFPYLRAAVTNLTAAAYVTPPLNLPVINGPIFPEDREVYAFTVGEDKLN